MRTYLLLRSILWQLAAIAEGLRPDLDEDDATWTPGHGSGGGGSGSAASPKQPPGKGTNGDGDDPDSWGPRDVLVAGLCTLRLLRANMYYLRAAGLSPGTVGLGTSSGGGGGGSSSGGARRESGGDQRSPFASGLLSLLLDYAGGVLDVVPVGGGGDGDGDEEGEEDEEQAEEMDSLRRAVRYEAAEVVGQSLDIFLPEAAQKVGFLTALFQLGLGGVGEDGDGSSSSSSSSSNDAEEDGKSEGKLEESKAWGGDVAVAAAAMADGPLPVDMDEEGCAALISGVCNAVCSDPNLLLTLVPEAVRPALTMRDVPSYVAAKVRSAEKAQAQAVQQRMLKEAAASAASAVATPPSGSSAGGRAGGGSASSSSSPRLVDPRGGRGGAGGEDGDEFELWKSGRAVDLPRSGDVVVRGPDWAWGEQDGDVAGRGLVVGQATWGRAVRAGGGSAAGGGGGGGRGGARESAGGGAGTGSGCSAVAERNAVRVMWEKGAINVYRWGAVDPTGKPCYDLKVLRAPALAQDEPPRDNGGGGGSDAAGAKATGGGGGGGGKSKGQPQGGVKGRSNARGELKWSVDEVEAALVPPREGGGRRGSGGGVSEGPTTREVLRFIKNNAPQEWREPRRITGAENALVKVMVVVFSRGVFVAMLCSCFTGRLQRQHLCPQITPNGRKRCVGRIGSSAVLLCA